MPVSEFHLYLLLTHDFHNKHNFSQKPTRFSSGSDCCDKLRRKKVAAFPGTGVSQFGLSMHAHACPCTHTHTVGGAAATVHTASLSPHVPTDEESVMCLIWPGCHSPFGSLWEMKSISKQLGGTQ